MAGDLVKFLRERLDEDEAVAKQVAAGNGLLALVFAEHSEVPRKLGERMLAEVTAKRAILAEHSPHEVQEGPEKGTQACGAETDWNDSYLMVAAWPCPTVRHLAAVYAGHPDYDPEWAPGQQYQAARNDS